MNSGFDALLAELGPGLWELVNATVGHSDFSLVSSTHTVHFGSYVMALSLTTKRPSMQEVIQKYVASKGRSGSTNQADR